MITIEAYRARVGCFCSIARKGKAKVPKSQNCFEGGSFYWPDFLLTFFMFICIMTLCGVEHQHGPFEVITTANSW